MTTQEAAVKSNGKVGKAVAVARSVIVARGLEENPVKRAQANKQKNAIASASAKSAEAVVKLIAGMKLTTTTALDDISNAVTSELESLKEVQFAVAAQQAKLDELYKIEASAETLEALLLAHEQAKAEHERQMEADKARWEEAKKTKARLESQFLVDLQDTRKREQELHEYTRDKHRREENDKFAAELARKRAEFDSVQAGLAAREKALKDQETEVAALREKVAKTDEVIKSAVGQAVGMERSRLEREHKHELEVTKLNYQSDLNLKAAQIVSLASRIEDLSKTNAALDAKYKEASDKVQTIAEKAIEGASKQAINFQVPTDNGSGVDRRK